MPMSIIVPLDGSSAAERALPVAATLARRSGGSVTFFTGLGAGVPADVDAYLNAQAERVGIVAKHEIGDAGDIATSLAALAASHSDSSIIMSSRAPTALDDVLVGSVTAEMLRLTTSPVLLLGPHLEQAAMPLADDYRTMLICVDGSAAAESMLPIAERWSELLGLTIWIVQVVAPGTAGDTSPGHERLSEVAYVQRLASQLPGDHGEVEFDVLHDYHPAKAILRFAAKLPRPIIAMTTHGRTGLRRFVMGSVTMSVLRHATGPVLVMRPTDMQE